MKMGEGIIQMQQNLSTRIAVENRNSCLQQKGFTQSRRSIIQVQSVSRTRVTDHLNQESAALTNHFSYLMERFYREIPPHCLGKPRNSGGNPRNSIRIQLPSNCDEMSSMVVGSGIYRMGCMQEYIRSRITWLQRQLMVVEFSYFAVCSGRL